MKIQSFFVNEFTVKAIGSECGNQNDMLEKKLFHCCFFMIVLDVFWM